MTIWLERAEEQFPAFLERIGAEGDLDAAVAEWDTVHNSCTESTRAPTRDRQARDEAEPHAVSSERTW
ncbi:hypothetical protein [Glycomyces xiaoerkulensis]|uniref:hypothetical protein n=1 Tax=Glycomyces xiaoerkulensis TaxID=2038139 RepID=UPI000C25CDFE|nr:hypothetical protein [Glycomyces xiaoerkulensis]